jgi:hypothetical protein
MQRMVQLMCTVNVAVKEMRNPKLQITQFAKLPSNILVRN